MAFGPIALGLLLLILSVFISMNLQVAEMPTISGFVGGMFEPKKEDLTNIQCGVDMQPCPNGLRCMNGFCRGESIPVLKGTGLKVVP
jgi:hypothetical protein